MATLGCDDDDDGDRIDDGARSIIVDETDCVSMVTVCTFEWIGQSPSRQRRDDEHCKVRVVLGMVRTGRERETGRFGWTRLELT